ncbi:MAG TPA: hypothetical protein VNO83_21445 [Pseudonocardia sp.]|nr:hypothetical protein [Pseudonocardia sp.]
MYSTQTVDRVLQLCVANRTTREVSRLTSIPESTIAHWRRGDRRTGRRAACPRCSSTGLPDSYSYLLGSYLGDGHITTGRRGVHALSISCADAWPGVMNEVEAAMREALGRAVCHVQRHGCVDVKSYSRHWTCLFPQHGPGPKHSRPIRLSGWQQEAVARHQGRFLRGLFHSDGCRISNWTRRRVAGEWKRYEYPRYVFTNTSQDILGLCAAALDQLGIAYTRPRADTISVARRAAVAALDVHVGPKS